MLTASYNVVSSDAGYMEHLITMGPPLGANFCCGFYSVSHFLDSWKAHLYTGPIELKTLMP